MQRYKIVKALGDGTYGSVLRAQDKNSGEVVAIKKFKQKYTSWEECIKLREIASLRKLIHPNIVRLKEVIRENDELHLVFEHMESNLYEFTKAQTRKLPEAKIRNLMFQVLQGLNHVHKNGYFHRDMKPENILVRGDVVKLADFGLAREIRARPPFTDYVSTRWYRAPEALLRSSAYNSPLDLWACGGIMAELYTFRPLFPGSSESDQLYKICTVLGPPTQSSWPDGHKLAAKIGFRFPQCAATRLDVLVPNASTESVDVMYSMLQWDPSKRASVFKCLQHPYFEASGGLPSVAPERPSLNHAGSKGDNAANAFGMARPSLNKAPSGTTEFPGNFLLNNLSSSKGGCTIGRNGGQGTSGAGNGKEDASHPSTAKSRGVELPPLQGPPQQPSPPDERSELSRSKPGSSSRYLRMARYQPGMQQTPTPQATNAKAMMQRGGTRDEALPLAGFGARLAREESSGLGGGRPSREGSSMFGARQDSLPDLNPGAGGLGPGPRCILGARGSRMFGN
mmetsp:Transcript_23539/g.65439  ORF Transcript_23539/g.65439 Transcript_23539/m.65439 type:complete len:510 (-) Transcript_23539:294-1823(-)